MKKLFFLLSISFFLSSCVAPRVVTQLTPEAPEGHFEMGREYISLANDSILVELGYDGIHGEHLVFDFVVINQTPDLLSINPSDFYYVQLDSATADTTKLPPRMAIHPQRILHHYKKTIESRQEAKSVNSFLGFVEAGIGLLASTSAFIASDDPSYLVDAVFGTLGTAEQYVAQDNQITTDIKVITSEKEVVNEEIFRLTELPVGKAVSGYVYFPKHPESGYYMFCFPIQDQMFQFVYNQRKVYQYD